MLPLARAREGRRTDPDWRLPTPRWASRCALSLSSHDRQAPGDAARVGVSFQGSSRGTGSKSELRHLRQDNLRVVQSLSEIYGPIDVDRMKRGFNGILKESVRLGQITEKQYESLASASWTKPSRRAKRRRATASEAEALLQVCAHDASCAGARDAVLIRLLAAEGLRAIEVMNEAWNGRPSNAFTRGSRESIDLWIGFRGPEPGPLLFAISRNHMILRRPLTRRAVAYAVSRRAAQTGLDNLAPEDIRCSLMHGKFGS